MLRTILVLVLASSAWADTFCSREPTICDGTYNSTSLCAPLHTAHRVPCTNEGGAGVMGERRRERMEGVGWWRRRGGAHADLPPAADLMPPRAPLSQEPSQQQPDWRLAHAARAVHRPDGSVSHRSLAPPPPSRGRVGGGRRRRGAARREARVSHLPSTSASPSPFPHDPAPAPLSQEPC